MDGKLILEKLENEREQLSAILTEAQRLYEEGSIEFSALEEVQEEYSAPLLKIDNYKIVFNEEMDGCDDWERNEDAW